MKKNFKYGQRVRAINTGDVLLDGKVGEVFGIQKTVYDRPDYDLVDFDFYRHEGMSGIVLSEVYIEAI